MGIGRICLCAHILCNKQSVQVSLNEHNVLLLPWWWYADITANCVNQARIG